MQEVCKLLGVGKSKSSRLHPQGDCLEESMVKQVKSCIQKQVDSHGRDWDLHLQSAVYAIRSNPNNSTKVTPAELIFGTKLSLPAQLLAAPSPKTLQQPATEHHVKQAQQFACDLGTKLQKSFTTVKKTFANSREKMKEQYDKQTKKHHYQPHDTVMLWHPNKTRGVSHCWQPKWSGPWTIKRLIGDLNCEIISQDEKKRN